MLELRYETPRSYNLCMPLTLTSRKKSKIDLPSPKKQYSDDYRRFSEQFKLPNINRTRPRIESCNAAIGCGDFLGNIKESQSAKVLKFLPYIYAQSGFERIHELMNEYDLDENNSPTIQRRDGYVNIFDGVKSKHHELQRSKTFFSVR